MRILTLELRTNQLIKIKNFYVNKLGFSLIDQTEESFTILVGETKLTFVQEDGSDPYYHFAMNIPENKMDESRDWLLQHSCQLLQTASTENNIHADKSIVYFDTNWHYLW